MVADPLGWVDVGVDEVVDDVGEVFGGAWVVEVVEVVEDVPDVDPVMAADKATEASAMRGAAGISLTRAAAAPTTCQAARVTRAVTTTHPAM